MGGKVNDYNLDQGQFINDKIWADAKSTPAYSSDLHILGIIMQLSDCDNNIGQICQNPRIAKLGA